MEMNWDKKVGSLTKETDYGKNKKKLFITCRQNGF